MRARALSELSDDRARMSRNHPVLVGLNDEDARDTGFGVDCGCIAVVLRVIQRDSEGRESATCGSPNCGGVLADAAGEDQYVDAAERCDVGADRFSYLIAHHLDGEIGVLVVL